MGQHELKESHASGGGSMSRGFTALMVIAAVGMLASFALIFGYAPSEKTMGIVYKIFYFHVPNAIAMGVLFVMCSVCSLIYLANPSKRMDALAATAAELAVLTGVVVLISGPLWARKAWGHWWNVYDARLNITLVSVFIFIGYFALRAFMGDRERGRMVSAGLGVLGAPAFYFIKIAVEKWGGNHPKNVVYGKSEGLEDPKMKLTFLVSLVSVFLLVMALFWVRYNYRMLQDRLDEFALELDELGLLGEG